MTKLTDYERKLINLLGIDPASYERNKKIRECFQPVIYEKRMTYDWDKVGHPSKRRGNVTVLISK